MTRKWKNDLMPDKMRACERMDADVVQSGGKMLQVIQGSVKDSDTLSFQKVQQLL